MMGQDTAPAPAKINLARGERGPTAKELSLWNRAETIAKQVNLLSFVVKNQYQNIILTHTFAQKRKIGLNEPDLPEIEKRMMIALRSIEDLKDIMCEVNQLELGVRVSSSGDDLDIVKPETTNFGWVLPAAIGAVIVVGIIVRWASLEKEVVEITAAYNGILRRSNMALCNDPDSQICQDWEAAKASGGYFKRQSIIDSVKNAVSTVGKVAKTGLSTGLAIAIPLLLWIYAPRKKG